MVKEEIIKCDCCNQTFNNYRDLTIHKAMTKECQGKDFVVEYGVNVCVIIEKFETRTQDVEVKEN